MSTAVDTGTLLPWPAGWSPRPTVRAVLVHGFLGTLALGILWSGAAAFLAMPEIGILLFVAAICRGTLMAMDLWSLCRRPRVSSKAVTSQVTGSAYDGVAISYSSRFCGLFRTFLSTSFWVVVVCAAVGIMGELLPSGTPSPDTVPLTGFVGLMLLLVWVGWSFWVLVEIVGRRVARGRLVIGPEGIYHRSHTFEHFVPWDAIIALHAVQSPGGPLVMAMALPSEAIHIRRTGWIGKQDEFKLLPDVVVRGHFLAVDPAVAYHALRYYRDHPESRVELLTHAGEQRVRSGKLLD